MSKISTFLNESKEEFSRVSWLSRKQTAIHTVVVIIVCALFTVLLVGLDWGFAELATFGASLF